MGREEDLPGLVTPDWRTRFDELRERLPKDRRFHDSSELIREQREKRTRQLIRAAFRDQSDEDEDDECTDPKCK